MARKLVPALAYFRTSSAANVGHDKDSERRQRAAVREFSSRNGYEIVAEYYDGAVRGADPIDTRPGFASMLKRLKGNGVSTVIVETASRSLANIIIQESGMPCCASGGSRSSLLDSPTAFQDDTPTGQAL